MGITKMSRSAVLLVILATVTFEAPQVRGQWYADPQMTTNEGSQDDSSANSLLYGGNGVLYGNGFTPGNGILPQGGLLPGGNGATATTSTGSSGSEGDQSGGSVSAGYQFTSDPISAYANAVYTGMSNLIRSEGQYNQATTKAMINFEQARTLYIENQERLVNARRSIHRSMLAAQAEDVEYRHAKQARAAAFLASHRPPPLGPKQLDASTARIRWPQALMSPDFDALRTKIDNEFVTRVRYGSDPEVAAQIRRDVHDMQDLLHEHVLKLPLENYAQARLFLDQLAVSGD